MHHLSVLTLICLFEAKCSGIVFCRVYHTEGVFVLHMYNCVFGI